MDNSVDSSPTAWATPRPAGIALLVGGTALIAAGLLFGPDPVGIAMMVFGGTLLIAFGAIALIVRPRLKIDGTPDAPALTVRTLTGTATYPLERVHRIRLLSLRRIGRRTDQIELDLLPDDVPLVSDDPGPRSDTRYLVYNRWDLGEDLGSVVETLERAGFPVEGS